MLQVPVPEEEIAKIKKYCKINGIKMGYFVRQIIKKGFEEIEKQQNNSF